MNNRLTFWQRSCLLCCLHRQSYLLVEEGLHSLRDLVVGPFLFIKLVKVCIDRFCDQPVKQGIKSNFSGLIFLSMSFIQTASVAVALLASGGQRLHIKKREWGHVGLFHLFCGNYASKIHFRLGRVLCEFDFYALLRNFQFEGEFHRGAGVQLIDRRNLLATQA